MKVSCLVRVTEDVRAIEHVGYRNDQAWRCAEDVWS
jgi:hypothetical protein